MSMCSIINLSFPINIMLTFSVINLSFPVFVRKILSIWMNLNRKENMVWHLGEGLVKEVLPSVAIASSRCQISIKKVSKVIVELSVYCTYGKTSARFILHGYSNNLSMYTNTEAYVVNDINISLTQRGCQ